MTTFDRAPLPPPSKRGRKPNSATKAVVHFESTPSGPDDGWVSKVFKSNSVIKASTEQALSKGTGAFSIDYDKDNNTPAVEAYSIAQLTTAASRPRSKCCGRDLVYEGCFYAVPDTGWTTGEVITRFPPEAQDMLIGGHFNGQYRDMSEYAGEYFACVGIEDYLQVEWYERCPNPGAWIWVASVYPNGIQLRTERDA